MHASLDASIAVARLREALDLAKKIESLLDHRDDSGLMRCGPARDHEHESESSRTGAASSVHTMRMARAMAAGLVDELEAVLRPARTPS